MDFIDPQRGWALVQRYDTQPRSRITDAIVSTNDGGITWVSVNLPALAESPTTADGRVMVSAPVPLTDVPFEREDANTPRPDHARAGDDTPIARPAPEMRV